MAFIRVLLIFLLIYFVIRFIGRLLFGYIGMRTMNNRGEQASNHYKRKEGDISVSVKPEHNEKKIPRDEGEYVKFEEVKD